MTVRSGEQRPRFFLRDDTGRIRIELKRRHDGSVVEHERETLSSVVTERRLARLGETPTARAKGALVESYPALKSDEAFAKLTQELTRCENKLALARTFYNESVTNLNIRVESFPAQTEALSANRTFYL